MVGPLPREPRGGQEGSGAWAWDVSALLHGASDPQEKSPPQPTHPLVVQNRKLRLERCSFSKIPQPPNCLFTVAASSATQVGRARLPPHQMPPPGSGVGSRGSVR